MLANLDGRQIMYQDNTVFTVEVSRYKKAYEKEYESVGNPYMACRILRMESRGVKRRLLINGKPVARHN